MEELINNLDKGLNSNLLYIFLIPAVGYIIKEIIISILERKRTKVKYDVNPNR